MSLSKPKKPKCYDENTMIAAIAAVKNGASYMKAAKDYSVPYTTLHDKCNAKYNKEKKGTLKVL